MPDAAAASDAEQMEWEPLNKIAYAPQTKAPVFLVIAGVCLVLSLGVPRILLTLPILIVVVSALVSIFRKESMRPLSWLVLLLAAVLFISNAVEMNQSFSKLSGAPDTTANLSKARISNMVWRIDPTFGSRGTVKWTVTVRNQGEKPMNMVGVSFTTYDSHNKVVATTTGFVNAIPPGEERSEEHFADFYGSEKSARALVSSVTYADQ